jgi:hypothetical protein
MFFTTGPAIYQPTVAVNTKDQTAALNPEPGIRTKNQDLTVPTSDNPRMVFCSRMYVKAEGSLLKSGRALHKRRRLTS